MPKNFINDEPKMDVLWGGGDNPPSLMDEAEIQRGPDDYRRRRQTVWKLGMEACVNANRHLPPKSIHFQGTPIE